MKETMEWAYGIKKSSTGYGKDAKSNVQVGVSSTIGTRRAMEDCETVLFCNDSEKSGNDCHFFAIFDGHSGSWVSKKCSEKLANHLILEDKKSEEEEGEGESDEKKGTSPPSKTITPAFENDAKIKESFVSFDKELIRMMKEECCQEGIVDPDDHFNFLKRNGCTCISTFVRHVKDDKEGDYYEIICANVGDSRCVLYNCGRIIPLNTLHEPGNPKESERINKCGSFLTPHVHETVSNRSKSYQRIEGRLNVSRAFGDFDYKGREKFPQLEQAIICEPDIMRTTISGKYPDFPLKYHRKSFSGYKFMVLGCDGLWDYMSEEEVYDFVFKRLEEQKIGAEHYLEKVVKRLYALYTDKESHIYESFYDAWCETSNQFQDIVKKRVKAPWLQYVKNGGEMGFQRFKEQHWHSRIDYFPSLIAQELTDYCIIKKKSSDNVSVMIVLFPDVENNEDPVFTEMRRKKTTKKRKERRLREEKDKRRNGGSYAKATSRPKGKGKGRGRRRRRRRGRGKNTRRGPFKKQ
ncbi:MAG: PP2C family serine/threonine-protein phosphatase [Promethearchaeota archaeon]